MKHQQKYKVNVYNTQIHNVFDDNSQASRGNVDICAGL